MPILPNFLVLGPPRTGTTWLHECFASHFEIEVPNIKQVHFFDRNYFRGVEWYKAFFQASQVLHRAEVTPDYLRIPLIGQRIIDTLGNNTKVIIVYRDPVERAFSHYKLKLGAGKLKNNVTFLEALDTDNQLVADSLYYDNLSRLLQHVPSDNIMINSYKLLSEDPEAYLNNIAEFLGIDVSQFPTEMFTQRRAQSGGKPKFYWLAKSRTKLRYSMQKTRLTSWLFTSIRHSSIWHKYKTKKINKTSVPKLTDYEADKARKLYFEYDQRKFMNELVPRFKFAYLDITEQEFE